MSRNRSRDAAPERTPVDGPRPKPKHPAAPAGVEGVPLSTPIVRSTTFAAASAADHARLLRDRQPTFYQRFGAPNERQLEAQLAALEGGEDAAVFASGMAAITTTLLTLLPHGGHVVAARAIFEQTARVLDWMARACAVEIAWVDGRDPAQVAAALRPGTTALLYVETPSNPLLHVVDVAALATLATSAGVRLVVDATFASPALSRTLSHGAHLVVHSLTKLINGHSDAMGGAVIGDAATINTLKRQRELFGGVLDPQACWLIERGLATLPLRAARVSATALRIATALERHPAVAAVRYPLLPSHEGFAVAQRQMRAGGPVVTFRLHGGVAAARRLVGSLRLVKLANQPRRPPHRHRAPLRSRLGWRRHHRHRPHLAAALRGCRARGRGGGGPGGWPRSVAAYSTLPPEPGASDQPRCFTVPMKSLWSSLLPQPLTSSALLLAQRHARPRQVDLRPELDNREVAHVGEAARARLGRGDGAGAKSGAKSGGLGRL